MRDDTPNRRPVGWAALAIALLAAGFALGWTPANGQSERPSNLSSPPDRRQRIADLELAFWRCQQAAGAHLLSPTDDAVCAAISDELRKRKFGGDSEWMLQWWQQSRLATQFDGESVPEA